MTNAMVGFDDFVRSHPVWGDLWNSWRSSAFRKDAFDLLGSEMREGLLERTGSSVPARMHGAALRSRLVHRVDFDVNYSVRGYRLTPHTDSPKKLLALVLYLPAADRPEVGAGTGFWKRRVGTVVPEDAWWSKGQLPRLVDGYDSSDRVDGVMDRFRAAMEQFHLAEYAPNTLVGFVKTQDSWHDVDLRDFPEGARRRVVLYNINLR